MIAKKPLLVKYTCTLYSTLKHTQTRKEKGRHRVYLFAHCLHRSCADYIRYRIWMRHMSELFHSRNGIIVICILMNILKCVQYHLAGSSSGRQAFMLSTSNQYCSPALAYIFFFHIFAIAFVPQSIFNLNFRFMKMDFYIGHWL